MTSKDNVDDRPTDPSGLTMTHDDILAYLVGSVQRIEVQLSLLTDSSNEEPPAWAKKLFEEIQHIKTNCKNRHENGKHVSL
jgi:hypothetical protein